MAYQQPDPFWEFIRSFDPNTPPAGGQSNPGTTNNNNDSPPDFLRGFPFFNPAANATGYGPHHGPGHHGRGRRHGPPPHHPWAGGPYVWGGEWPFQQQHEASQQARQRQEEQLRQHREQQRQREEQQQQQQQQQREQEKSKETEKEKDSSPDTMMGDSDAPDPAEVTPDESGDDSNNPPPYPRGHCRRGRRHRDRESRRQPDQQQGPFPFDLNSLLSTISSHPILQNLQAQAQAADSNNTNTSSSGSFAPPLDLFNTPAAYILHLALPGALKPDVGVDWDPERNVLRVAGVVHRPGDEAFQATLVQGERRVGVFEREVKLPPTRGAGETKDNEEIDADGITAKMEDGVLVVTVPKVEKEWTEIRKVDIE